MDFEKGKIYQFTDKQFNIGRDSNNRLNFIVPDPASTVEYRIVAFDFQNQRIPEKITCIFNGKRLEQDPMSVAPQLYRIGQKYEFYINSEIRNGRCTLRDEVNDVTYKNVKIGKTPYKRFDRITCVIDSTSGSTLELTPVLVTVDKVENFGTEQLLSLPEARHLRHGVLEHLMHDSRYSNAALQLADGDNSWVVTFLEAALSHSMEVIKRHVGHKVYLLRGIEALAVALIERSDYVTLLDTEQQAGVQLRLEIVARNAGDYSRVFNLVACREADSTMQTILGSLEKSRRFYQPEEKVRLLNAMLVLEAVDVDKYMDRVLHILDEHHTNPMFMNYFKKGMQQLLAQFVEGRDISSLANDRDALRLLIRALAMEQLLNAGAENDEIARRRGLIYLCGALLVNSCNNALPTKAIQSFAGLTKAPLEFTWADLRDISRFCYAAISQPFSPKDLSDDAAFFPGDRTSLTFTADTITVAPNLPHSTLKKSITYSLFPGMSVIVLTPERLSGIATAIDSNPMQQKRNFQSVMSQLATMAQPIKKNIQSSDLLPEVGEEMDIYITGLNDNGFFECSIADKVYSGKGLIGIRDIVAYDIRADINDFYLEGKPLLFKAVIRDILPDGTYLFSMRRKLAGYLSQKAEYDLDSGNEVLATITTVYKNPNGYFAISESGYPMVVWLPAGADFKLLRGDTVVVQIIEAASQNENIYVKASYLDFIDPEDEDFDSIPQLNAEKIFADTLLNFSGGRVFQEEEAGEEISEEIQKTKPMPATGIDMTARLVNLLSSVDHNGLGRCYSMLCFVQMLAKISDMKDFLEMVELKRGVLEAMGDFAQIGRVDSKALEPLSRRRDELPIVDNALNRNLELLRILACLDNPDFWKAPDYTSNRRISDTARLVSAYNQLWGMGLKDARREILKGIYNLLGLPMPDEFDVVCLKVQEDEHNEFKQSLIYPADNNMKADDRRQGREIMEIVCGMLNHEGGIIYLGVNNQGVPVGLDNDFRYLNGGSERYDVRDIEDKFALNFHYHLRTNIGLTIDGIPVTDYVKLSFDTLEGKIIGRVTVEPFPGMVKMKDGKVYYRQDSSTLQLPPREQAAFALRRGASRN